MLDVAKLKKTDLLYDLGCGDGRIVVTAAKKYGVKAIGFDIDPQRVRESRENVAKNDVGNLVTIELKDVFKVDLTPATVVTLYLLPELNVKSDSATRETHAGSAHRVARLRHGGRRSPEKVDDHGAPPPTAPRRSRALRLPLEGADQEDEQEDTEVSSRASS